MLVVDNIVSLVVVSTTVALSSLVIIIRICYLVINLVIIVHRCNSFFNLQAVVCMVGPGFFRPSCSYLSFSQKHWNSRSRPLFRGRTVAGFCTVLKEEGNLGSASPNPSSHQAQPFQQESTPWQIGMLGGAAFYNW